jgi:hypothetical protein
MGKFGRSSSLYPWGTQTLYATGKFSSRGVHIFCTPPVLGHGQPTPSHHMSVASTYSVRHGYGYSRGVHFSCTPPLRSRGVQKFLYAMKDNSSYSYFPSSGSRRTSCMSLYPRGGLRKGVYPLQWEKTLASTNYSRGSLHIRRWSRTVRWNENAHPNGWHAIVPGHVIGGPATTISDRCHHSLGRLICYSYIFVLYLCINRLRINEHVNKCNGHMSPFGA